MLRRWWILALPLGVACVLLWRDHPRVAFAVGDLPPGGAAVPPNVLIIYDMSANQNANMGTATAPNNHLGGYSGPVKKYMAFQVVLTGALQPTSGPPVTAGKPGLMDLHLDDIRFGFASIDGKSSTATTNAGGFSYGPSWTATSKYDWPSTSLSVSSMSAATVNQGLRRGGAGMSIADFPMRPIFTSADKAVDNVYIQNELMGTAFSSNNDGLMDAFRDAHHYFTVDFPALAAGRDCGDKFVIYVGAGTSGTSYSDMNEWIAKLKDAGVITYAVGLTKDGDPKQPHEEAYYDAIATAGGGTCANSPDVYGAGYGHCAYIARGGSCSGADPNCDLAGASDLAEKLGTVLAIILNQVTSRTRAATSDAPILSTADGQWRVNAYFQVFPGLGGAWRGFLRAAQVNALGDITAEIDFDGKLNARAASTRKIYSRTAAGAVAPLADVLAAEFGAFVDAQRAFFTPTKPCIAHAFFDSTGEWYRMLSGGTADNLGSLDCTASKDDAAIVQNFQAHKLGDIYHSSPTVVGPPELFLADPGYQAFFLANQNRPTMIYVGANDGMLHAFYLRHADGSKVGQEAWAFVPRQVIERLPNRILAHDYYVDGPIVARDVQVARASVDEASWRTVLVAGLGRGGATYFALDVTDPESPEFLWEFTDPRLAQTIASAAIGRVFLDGVERPVAFLSGGWNPGGDGTEGRVVAVVDLFTGALIKAFDTTAPMTGGPTAYLDMPTTLTSRVFVGDQLGRLWRVDVSGASAASWSADVFFPEAGGAYSGASYQRPIFFAPSVSIDPLRQVTIYYGTGNIDSLDVVEENYFWGIREVWNGASFTAEILDPTRFPVRFSSSEKLIGEPVVWNGVVLFTTFTASASECGFGEGKLYGIDYQTGEPRLTTAGQLTFAGASGAVSSISLGPGVPSTPLIRQRPATVGWSSTGQATITGGQYEAVIQTGADTRTDELADTTVEIDLGSVQRRADILTVAEME